MYSQQQRLGRGGSNPSGISKRHFEDCQALANEILLFELFDCVGAMDANHINDKQLLDPIDRFESDRQCQRNLKKKVNSWRSRRDVNVGSNVVLLRKQDIAITYSCLP